MRDTLKQGNVSVLEQKNPNVRRQRRLGVDTESTRKVANGTFEAGAASTLKGGTDRH